MAMVKLWFKQRHHLYTTASALASTFAHVEGSMRIAFNILQGLLLQMLQATVGSYQFRGARASLAACAG